MTKNVLWLTGISGSGKSTLGVRVRNWIKEKGHNVVFLDGDEVREFFENDLGYTPKERAINVKRIAFAAKLVADNGTDVVVANIAPYKEVRDFIRKKIPNYTEIYVKSSLETVIERDVKGHYAKYKSGEMKNIVGGDDRYDEPVNPDVIVDTENETIDESFQKIIGYIENNNLLKG